MLSCFIFCIHFLLLPRKIFPVATLGSVIMRLLGRKKEKEAIQEKSSLSTVPSEASALSSSASSENDIVSPSETPKSLSKSSPEHTQINEEFNVEVALRKLRERQNNIVHYRKRQVVTSKHPPTAPMSSSSPAVSTTPASTESAAGLEWFLCRSYLPIDEKESLQDNSIPVHFEPNKRLASEDSQTEYDESTDAIDEDDDYDESTVGTRFTLDDEGEDISIFRKADKFLLNPLGKGKLFSLQEQDDDQESLLNMSASDDDDSSSTNSESSEESYTHASIEKSLDEKPQKIQVITARANKSATDVELTLHQVTRIEI
jgi:hypothetical protein